VHNKLLTSLLFAASVAVPSALASDTDKTSDGSSASPASISTSKKKESTLDNRHPGIAFKTSLLGFGADVAVPMTRRSNLRVGFSAFNYGRGFDKDGVTYSGRLNLRSMQALYDFFPFGGFHLSPGVMMYSGNQLTGNATVPGGQTVSFGGVDYASDPSNPLKGSGKLQFSKAGPMFLIGFGNLARRGEHHFVTTFDIGAVYQGVPRTTLNFTGGACDPSGINCRDVSSDPTVQSNILSEQAKINHSASPFRFYPVISFGFGYKF